MSARSAWAGREMSALEDGRGRRRMSVPLAGPPRPPPRADLDGQRGRGARGIAGGVRGPAGLPTGRAYLRLRLALQGHHALVPEPATQAPQRATAGSDPAAR